MGIQYGNRDEDDEVTTFSENSHVRALQSLITCNFCGRRIIDPACSNKSHTSYQEDITRHQMLAWLKQPETAVARMGPVRVLLYLKDQIEAMLQDRDRWKDRATAAEQRIVDLAQEGQRESPSFGTGMREEYQHGQTQQQALEHTIEKVTGQISRFLIKHLGE